MPICAASAGTKLPICARMAISAFWRRKVDLPAMLGPVTSHSRPLAFGDRSQSLGTKAAALAACSAASTTGWRPRVMLKRQAIVHLGPHIARRDGEFAQRDARHPALPSASAMAAQRLAMFQRQHRHFVEQRCFQRQRAFGGFGNARGQRWPVRRWKNAPRPPWSGDGGRFPSSAISLSACCWLTSMK